MSEEPKLVAVIKVYKKPVDDPEPTVDMGYFTHTEINGVVLEDDLDGDNYFSELGEALTYIADMYCLNSDKFQGD